MKQITTETQLLKDLKKIGQRISRRIKDRYDIPWSVKSDVDEEVANAILYLLGKHDNRSKLLTYICKYLHSSRHYCQANYGFHHSRR